jgi:hypothetical protein
MHQETLVTSSLYTALVKYCTESCCIQGYANVCHDCSRAILFYTYKYTLYTLLILMQCSMFGLLLEYLVAECWFGPVMSVLQGSLPSGARGTGVALFSLVTTLAGSGAVWLLGYILDHTGHKSADSSDDATDDASASSVRDVLFIGAGAAYALAALLFCVGSLQLKHAASADAATADASSILHTAADERAALLEHNGGSDD